MKRASRGSPTSVLIGVLYNALFSVYTRFTFLSGFLDIIICLAFTNHKSFPISQQNPQPDPDVCKCDEMWCRHSRPKYLIREYLRQRLFGVLAATQYR